MDISDDGVWSLGGVADFVAAGEVVLVEAEAIVILENLEGYVSGFEFLEEVYFVDVANGLVWRVFEGEGCAGLLECVEVGVGLLDLDVLACLARGEREEGGEWDEECG